MKQMTGGDILTARFPRVRVLLRRAFLPTLKRFLATNHRPEIWDITPAMRRIKLILVPVSLPKPEPDRRLEDSLRKVRFRILRMGRGVARHKEGGTHPRRSSGRPMPTARTWTIERAEDS